MQTNVTRRETLKVASLAAAVAVAGGALASTARADEINVEAAGVQPDVAALAAEAAFALPSDVAALPTIVAEQFAEVAPGSDTDALEGIVCSADGTVYVCHRFRESVDGEEVTSSEICAIDTNGDVERFAYKASASFNGIAIHEDGRFFVADMAGHIWVYPAEGGGASGGAASVGVGDAHSAQRSGF